MSKEENKVQSLYSGTAEREDIHILPDTVGWVWETEQVIVGRNGSSASSNGAKMTWENSEVVDSLCAWHASNRWFQQHTSLVHKNKNLPLMKDNFYLFKECPKVDLVPVWKDKMLEHWTFAMKEKDIAEAWESVWGKYQLTRVDANEMNPISGGISSDNNAVESQNGIDKFYFNYRRKAACIFLDNLSKYLREQSLSDLTFTSKFKAEVNSHIFYKTVEVTMQLHYSGKPTFLSRTKPLTMIRHDVPQDSFVCAGDTFFNCLSDSEKPKNSLEAGKMMSKHSGKAPAAFKAFKLMLKNPAEYAKTKTFHELVYQAKCLKIIRPIDTKSTAEKASVMGLYKTLVACNIPIISIKEVFEKTSQNGLVSCDCGTYLKRGWCKQSFAFAMDRKIITGYPANMNPISTLKEGKKILDVSRMLQLVEL